jgi:hypothetical protein
MWESNDLTKIFLDELLKKSFPRESQSTVTLTSVMPTNRFGKKIQYKIMNKIGILSHQEYESLSIYGIVPPNRKSQINIWYTGENLRPPTGYDLTLSFDVDDYEGRNHYLPFFATRFSNMTIPVQNNIPDQSFFRKKRKLSFASRKFCSVVINNPHPLRIRLIEQLSRLGQVDIFGAKLGNPVGDKLAKLKEYDFNLCFENDLFPGYVTEKPFDAWQSGTIPLYWGDDVGNYLNPQAIVNYNGIGSLANFLEKVRYLQKSHDARSEMINQNLLNRSYDYEALLTKISILNG